MELFLTRKMEVKTVILVLIKDLKAKYGIHVKYTKGYNSRENKDF